MHIKLQLRQLLELTKGRIYEDLNGTWLGVVWWFLEPLLLMLVFYFVVALVFDRGGENYYLFVLTSLIVWQFFARSIVGGMNSIAGGGNLILRARISLRVLVLLPVVVNLFYLSMGMVVVVLVNGFVVESVAQLIYVMVSLLTFASLVGLILAVVVIYVRDLKKVMPLIVRGMWFLSPVLYGVERVTDSDKIDSAIKALYMFNPMVYYLESVRNAILGQGVYYRDEIIILFFASLFLFVVLSMMLERNYGEFAKRI